MTQSTAPRWYELAVSEIGTHEVPGPGDNPKIVEYWRQAQIYLDEPIHDSIAWCSVFACSRMELSGNRSPRSAWARDWLRWGLALDHPVLGCIVVLDRGHGFGHVGFFAGWDGDRIRLLGGNQSDSVCYATFDPIRVLGYRWPQQMGRAARFAPPGAVYTPTTTPRPAAPIPVIGPPESESDTLDRLRDQGSRTIEHADGIEKKQVAVGATSVLLLISNIVQQTTDAIGPLMPYLGAAGGLVILGLVAWAFKDTFGIKSARVSDDRNGLHRGRKDGTGYSAPPPTAQAFAYQGIPGPAQGFYGGDTGYGGGDAYEPPRFLQGHGQPNA